MFPLPVKVYEILGAVLIVLAFTAYVYHLGGVGPKAELASFKVQVAAAQKIHEAEDAKRDAQSKALITEKDANDAQSIAAIGSGYESYISSLRKSASLSVSHSEPISIGSSLCHDATDNQAISAALQGYRSALSRSVDEYRQSVAGLLKSADENTAQLISLQDFIAKTRGINDEHAP